MKKLLPGDLVKVDRITRPHEPIYYLLLKRKENKSWTALCEGKICTLHLKEDIVKNSTIISRSKLKKIDVLNKEHVLTSNMIIG